MKNYYRYYPEAEALPGVCLTGCGATRVKPGAEYPPSGHPGGRSFTWENGRVLAGFQLVAITEGAGRFRGESGKTETIRGGAWLLLWPGRRHRYQPDARTGWVEHWLELNGPGLGAWACRAAGAVDEIIEPGEQPELIGLFERLHRFATRGEARELLDSLGLHIAQSVLAIARAPRADPATERLRKAERWLIENLERPFSVQELAREASLHPASLRRLFRAKHGMGPMRYRLRLRIERARELVLAGDLTLAQIAESLGFDSAYHLSAQFKRRTGASPSKWRAERLRGAGASASADSITSGRERRRQG